MPVHSCRDRGFESFEVTYPVVEGGRAIIPFVSVQDDVLIYPDQIKSASLSTTERSWIRSHPILYMAHHDRILPEPEISEDEAAKALHPDLPWKNPVGTDSRVKTATKY